MTTQNIKKIGELFPSCITETKDKNGNLKKAINFDLLRQLLSDDIADIAEDDETYEFTWVGKRFAIAEAYKPTDKILYPCKEESINWDTTQNMYIEGDNLDALKLLQENFTGKVKMIYIDPPYNTGNDFVYVDDFKIDSKTWNTQIGNCNKKNNCQTKNSDINGRFHSAWCSMMYSRLALARMLLTNDGAIFISINDKELDNLKKICNELFGEENFVCCFIWNTKKAAQGMATANMIVTNHEYILVYARNINAFKFIGLERDENNGFSNPDNDPRGLWKRQYLQRLGQGLPVRTIVDPATGNSFSFETPYKQEKLDKWIQEGRIIFPADTSKYPARKEFLSEYKHKQQLITSLGLFATKATTEKLYSLFDGKKIFNNPKPDTLISFLVSQVSNDAIILDFFSGSATTADVVMQLNAQDGGTRQFIMVQIPEPCNESSGATKAGYSNICEIGKERIRRAGKKIKAGSQQATQKLDVGFRVFKVEKSEGQP